MSVSRAGCLYEYCTLLAAVKYPKNASCSAVPAWFAISSFALCSLGLWYM